MKTPLSFTKSLSVLFFLTFIQFFAVAQDGQNDITFNTYDNVSAQGADNTIRLSVIQPDNKIIIAGRFTHYNGTVANSLARLNIDGKTDKNFSAGLGPNSNINTIAVQYNGKILIGGDFTAYNGLPVNKITRLNANGSQDKTFKTGIGANNSIKKILIQPDEKILVAGNFTSYNNVPVKGLVRLNKNGTLDNTFNAAITDSLLNIHQMAVLPNGKIIITGAAWNVFGDMRNLIETLRLHKNGTRDYSFQECIFSVGDLYPTINSIGIENDGNLLLAGTNRDGGSSAPYHGLLVRVNGSGEILQRIGSFWINSMQIQADEKILALGFDNPEWGIIKRKVIRMNKDLSIDSSFILKDDKVYEDPSQSAIQSLSIQKDGKLIIAGNFYEINGLVVSNITRLKRNGDLDLTFDAGSGTNGKVYSIAVQSNGKILIGGSFTAYNGNACQNIARLNTDGSFDKTFTVTADDIVRKILVYGEDGIIIGGDFQQVNGVPRIAIARFQKNGSLDAGFQPFIDDIGCVYDFKIADDGKIYLALNYKNTPEHWIDSKIERLNIDGTTDPSFQIPPALLFKINAIELTSDHKILAGGVGYYADPWFYLPQGIVTRLHEDGSADSTFNYKVLKPYLDKEVRTIQVMGADKILIGGDFDADKLQMNHIGLIKDDGNINTNFVGNANGNVYSSVVVAENKLVIGGVFSEYATYVRNGLARMNFEEQIPDVQRSIEKTEAGEENLVLSLYPNPAASSITIDNLDKGSIFRIYNAAGVELYAERAQGSRSTIELSNYTNGIYFLIAENSGRNTRMKFVVIK